MRIFVVLGDISQLLFLGYPRPERLLSGEKPGEIPAALEEGCPPWLQKGFGSHFAAILPF